MREILFKGKRRDNGEWIEGYLIKYSDDFPVMAIGKDHFNLAQVEIDTISQKTPVKNLWENDIFMRMVI